MGKETHSFHQIAARWSLEIGSLYGNLCVVITVKKVGFVCSALFITIYGGGNDIIGRIQKRWEPPISQVGLLKGFCDLKLSFYRCFYFRKTLEIALSVCMCLNCFSLDTLRYALAACKFLLYCNEKSRYNVHIKHKGPGTVAGGSFDWIARLWRNSKHSQLFMFSTHDTWDGISTRITAGMGLLFYLPSHFAFLKENCPCFPVKLSTQRGCSLSFLGARYFISTWAAGPSKGIGWLAFHTWTSLEHESTASQLRCMGEHRSVFSPSHPQMLLLITPTTTPCTYATSIDPSLPHPTLLLFTVHEGAFSVKTPSIQPFLWVPAIIPQHWFFQWSISNYCPCDTMWQSCPISHGQGSVGAGQTAGVPTEIKAVTCIFRGLTAEGLP